MNSGKQILANNTDVVTFFPNDSKPNRFDVQVVSLASLKAPQPGQPVNATNLAYTPDDVELSADGKTLLILDVETQSIFRFDTSTLKYGQAIPLLNVPKFMAYSAENNAAYVAYASGLIDRIDLAAQTPSETPFAQVPTAPMGLSTTGKYVFTVDSSGAWDTHYTRVTRPGGAEEVVAAPATSSVSGPFTDVRVNGPVVTQPHLKRGVKSTAKLSLNNLGNVRSAGNTGSVVTLYAIPPMGISLTPMVLATVPVRRSLNPQQTAGMTLTFTLPEGIPPGPYELVAVASPLGAAGDPPTGGNPVVVM